MKNRILILIIIAGIIIASCKDSLNQENPNREVGSTYYNTTKRLGDALTATYAEQQGQNLWGRELFYVHDLRSDEFSSGGGQLETLRRQILIGTHSASNPLVGGVFTSLFRLIHRANTVIENAALVPATDDLALRDRYIAEARFLRAFAYYHLVGLYGGVPIYTTSAKSFEDFKPRATVDEVYDFIISELEEVQAVLPISYPETDLGRATKGAALAILGKAYLFKNNYASAKTQFEAIKALGIYSLTSSYSDNFVEETEFNKESVFEVPFNTGGDYNWDPDGDGTTNNEAWLRSQEYSAICWRNLIPSDQMLSEFEVNDPRIKESFYFIGDEFGDSGDPQILDDGMVQGNVSIFQNVSQKVTWKKYTLMYKTSSTWTVNNGINYRAIRYADILLNLAECENELGNGANAIAYLNQIRNRPSVSMPNYPTSNYPVDSKMEITRAIIHERAVELAGEESRNFDILRWRKQGKLATEPILYYASKFEFLPIPQQEIYTNTKLVQNPGY